LFLYKDTIREKLLERRNRKNKLLYAYNIWITCELYNSYDYVNDLYIMSTNFICCHHVCHF